MRNAKVSHADFKHYLQMLVRRRLAKFDDSILAMEIEGKWYAIEIKAGQTLSMYPNAMSKRHMQIHAEMKGGRLVVKEGALHWTVVFDEVLKGKFV